MTTVVPPLCMYCKHFDREGTLTCKAFPDGIPGAILDSEVDHREPHFGDNGVRFEKAKDVVVPEYFDEVFG